MAVVFKATAGIAENTLLSSLPYFADCFFVVCNPVKMPLIPLPESCTHVLAEFDCLDPLLSALRLDSGRLKVRFRLTSWSKMMG